MEVSRQRNGDARRRRRSVPTAPPYPRCVLGGTHRCEAKQSATCPSSELRVPADHLNGHRRRRSASTRLRRARAVSAASQGTAARRNLRRPRLSPAHHQSGHARAGPRGARTILVLMRVLTEILAVHAQGRHGNRSSRSTAVGYVPAVSATSLRLVGLTRSWYIGSVPHPRALTHPSRVLRSARCPISAAQRPDGTISPAVRVGRGSP